MDISIVVPLYNEEESLPELVSWIKKTLSPTGKSFEIIFIDDGSTDSSWQIIELLKKQESFIRAIKFRRNYGKSAALQKGFEAADGDVVITMDADLQDSPEEIPALYQMIKEEGYDLVSGWKKKRHDPITKRWPSKFYNRTARAITGIKLHDFNCGLKAYKKEVVKTIEVYGEMHRYIPVLCKKAGFFKIGEKVVQHQKRLYGNSKFGIERYLNGFLDLLSVSFISRFGKRPMHLFGSLGTLMFIVGFVMSVIVGADKLIAIYNDEKARLVAENPYFFIALTSMILGTQLFLAGFLGELISRNSHDRNYYEVEKEI
jgi:glycosyltransferase involved in cell wall biosynthesis